MASIYPIVADGHMYAVKSVIARGCEMLNLGSPEYMDSLITAYSQACNVDRRSMSNHLRRDWLARQQFMAWWMERESKEASNG